MGKAKVGTVIILLDEIEDDDALVLRLRALSRGTVVDLEVAGRRGRWERAMIELGPNERAGAVVSLGEAMSYRKALGDVPRFADIREIVPSEVQLATFGLRYNPWDTPENQVR